MGKISDVIRHAGEMSEETDDEDLWEDDETEETEAEEEDGSSTLLRDSEKNPGEIGSNRDASRNTSGQGTAPNISGRDMEQDFDRDASDGEPDQWISEQNFDPNISGDDQTGTIDGTGAWENSVAENVISAENGTFGQADETSAGDSSQPEGDTEPECNEEGIPLKDILYAESVRRQRKDQIVVQSVYDRKIIRDMLFRHAYLSTGGYCGLLISFCSIGAAIYTYGRIQVWISFVLLLAGCIFTVIEPFLLRDRAKQMTRKGGIYYMPILFVLTPYGIELTRNGNHASHDWGDITRVTTTKYAVIMYKGRHTALVMTKRGIGDQKDRLYEMIRKCARNAKYVKLK